MTGYVRIVQLVLTVCRYLRDVTKWTTVCVLWRELDRFVNILYGTSSLTSCGLVCVYSCDHGCCLVGAKMFISSGSGGENVWYNDLHYLDLHTLQWTRLEMEGNPPQPRDYPTLSSLSNLVSLLCSVAVSIRMSLTNSFSRPWLVLIYSCNMWPTIRKRTSLKIVRKLRLFHH